ncbi:hypothetical protein F5148DRAFT_1380071 [Russula earlei]|uniref:Uncharacterized protein n=1 Tax=Russula earlei TaxID=71964 RepID=A0ACC0TT54_9AGAM|nr:hypothetical protein F5148DRAFT_1380071 [Russula earlei]
MCKPYVQGVGPALFIAHNDHLSPERYTLTASRSRLRHLRYHVSLLTGFVQSVFSRAARSSNTIGGPSLEASHCEHRQDPVTINTLPDDVLIEIFQFFLNHWGTGTHGWHTLVHVCQNWRSIVFASPRRLNLRLLYGGARPMSEMLDVWPLFPVVIDLNSTAYEFSNSYPYQRWGNIAGALESEHYHRISQINLAVIGRSIWERLAVAMQKPFSELTFLRFRVQDNTVASVPDSFLGGSAPLLRYLSFNNCPFPGIPKLLLSANQLVELYLLKIPNSGYISPQDLVTALSVLSRLKTLRLGFESPRYPASRPRPPLTRSVLPALTILYFRGVHEYLEDLLAQIEAPLLNKLDVAFFMDIDFVIPQLHRLISKTESFKTCDRATVYTFDRAIRFTVYRGTNQLPMLSMEISCRELDWQLASLVQVYSSSFPLLSALVQLDITDYAPQSRWKDDMEATQWLELLVPFTAMKDLRLTHQVAPHVCQPLEELAGERVLPALQNIFLTGLKPSRYPKYIEGFVAARKLSGRPVAIHRWG